MPDSFTDWKAICETKYRYCRCLDAKDWVGYGDCFAEDAVLETPPAGSQVQGREAIVSKVRSLVESSVTNHQVHNPEVTFDGPNAANVIWALQDRNIWSADRSAQLGNAGHTGFGHYQERYVRCGDGIWRIQHQRLSYVHMDFYHGAD